MFKLMLPTIILLLAVSGCFWGEKKTEIQKSGRLEYIEYLRFGATGTHGGKGWYIDDRELKFDGKSWKPEKIDVKDLKCEPSPNQSVEALKCYSFGNMKQTVFIVRVSNNKPEFIEAAAIESVKGNDSGNWTEDGRWLLFRNYFFNVETSEKREVKNLPGNVDNCFITAAPDLETIIYRDNCYDFVRNEAGEVTNSDEYQKHYDEAQARQKNNIAAFWLIETKTGAVKIRELKIADYPFAKNPSPYLTVEWLKEFKSKLVWEKDKNGKEQLVYPK